METAPARKVLLIDDDPGIVESIRIFLDKEGYETFEANSGSQGVRLARETMPDLVVLDVEMGPGLSGPQVLRELKEDPRTRNIPILFLTGKVDLDAMEEALDGEAQGYILKPVKILDLLQKIEELLGEV